MRIESSRPEPQATAEASAYGAHDPATTLGAPVPASSGLDRLTAARADVTRLISVAASFEADFRLESAVRHLHRLEKQART